jgi:hypothetical protein
MNVIATSAILNGLMLIGFLIAIFLMYYVLRPIVAEPLGLDLTLSSLSMLRSQFRPKCNLPAKRGIQEILTLFGNRRGTCSMCGGLFIG